MIVLLHYLHTNDQILFEFVFYLFFVVQIDWTEEKKEFIQIFFSTLGKRFKQIEYYKIFKTHAKWEHDWLRSYRRRKDLAWIQRNSIVCYDHIVNNLPINNSHAKAQSGKTMLKIIPKEMLVY